ncbi:MAG: tRNA (N6-isopentenyl adenosine(37)-C2)-methylthiotransferase MiaB [Clostridiales bacterium]|jgi:tRNA-2-methylthio-N6-dimethylallyladenosine synthase|nr:tRNA (N6-isopentenyl adenosine(37)-C2)-methylthiotransferase MiaB [Clostridiales bacterium]
MHNDKNLHRTYETTLYAQADTAQALHMEPSERAARYYIVSYGCQMNAHDSEKIAGLLESCGYQQADNQDSAHLILFNTCCVREHAEKRVFGNVGALKKRKDEDPSLIIGVCGCMMQQKDVAERLFSRFPFVDFVFGTHSMHQLPQMLRHVLRGERQFLVFESPGEVIEGLPSKRMQGVSASVNVMYGCNNYCSYCIVPYVRGRERSRESGMILDEIAALAKRGYTEIQLLGQNVNSYGKDRGGIPFAQLLQMANDIDGIRRIRFMTSHPKDLSDALIESMTALPHVCDHLHLPVQSGSDRIQALMNRGYTRAYYLGLVEKLKKANPHIELTTDIIVGFPGETDEDYRQTLSLIEEVEFSAAFTFMYSPRAGTSAASMPGQIPAALKKERLLELNALQQRQTQKTNAHYIGTIGEVLVEGCDQRRESLLYGKLSCFKMVYFPGDPSLVGTYQTVYIKSTKSNSLVGELDK